MIRSIKLALGYEFIILQIGISIVGYITHQYLGFPIQRILGVALTISVVSPLLMLDFKTADLVLFQNLLQNYALIIPEQIAGLIIGSIVTGVAYIIRSVLNYLDIQIQ